MRHKHGGLPSRKSQPYVGKTRGKRKGRSTKKGNPSKGVKKSSKFAVKGKRAKKVQGKIHSNIEALMAAKVVRNHGSLRLSDLSTVAHSKIKVQDELRDIKIAKRKAKQKHAKPEKVHMPRW